MNALDLQYFANPTVTVALDLLGKILQVRDDSDSSLKKVARIVEVEAYTQNDPASHAYCGVTRRNQVMFGPAGMAYVYFIYGMHRMLNFVTERKGTAGAVLIRAAEPLFGFDQPYSPHLTRGPGRLCRALGIEMKDNGHPLNSGRFEVFDDGYQVKSPMCTPRVGISRARDVLWRFVDFNSPWICRVPENQRAQACRN